MNGLASRLEVNTWLVAEYSPTLRRVKPDQVGQGDGMCSDGPLRFLWLFAISRTIGVLIARDGV